MSNQRNRQIYRCWAPVYDALLGRLYAAGRRATMAALAPRPGQRVLLPGVGTGADLPLLPAGVSAVGVDLSPAMLARARAKLPLLDRSVLLICADAQALPLRDGVCDVGLLNLIVSVVPDGAACVREAARVVRPGGRMAIFDKFLPERATAGIGRRLLNLFARRVGTDINRRLGDLLAGSGCAILADRPAALGGAYRVIVVQVDARPSAPERSATRIRSERPSTEPTRCSELDCRQGRIGSTYGTVRQAGGRQGGLRRVAIRLPGQSRCC